MSGTGTDGMRMKIVAHNCTPSTTEVSEYEALENSETELEDWEEFTHEAQSS